MTVSPASARLRALCLAAAIASLLVASWIDPAGASAQSAENSSTEGSADSESARTATEGSVAISDGSALSSIGSSRLGDPLVAPRGSAQLPDALGSGDGSSDGQWLGSSVPAFKGLSSNGAGSSSSGDSFAMAQLSSEEDRGEPSPVDYGPEPRLLDTRPVEGNLVEIDVWSPANHSIVTNLLLRAPQTDTPASTLVLMSGADGGAGGANWHTETDYEEFFADKQVNVVTPIGGGASMYVNWENTNSPAGRNQWATYLGEELPRVVQEEFNGTGQDAIAGLSMSGGPALHIAAENPERFAAAASFSGFPASSGVLGRIVSQGILKGSEGSSVDAFGLSSSDAWQLNDPSYDPAALRTTDVFVGTAYGIPTAEELGGNWTWGLTLEAASQVTSNYFTRAAQARGVHVERFHTTFGAHSYALFERELHAAWDSTLAPALGLE